MKAIVITPSADGGTLEWRDVPEPAPRPGELLIRVRATGLNRADLAQRRGAYPRPATGGNSGPNIAGLEAAGEVAGLGEGVTGFAIGDRGMAMCAGGYAEYTTIDQRLAVRVPERLSWEEAAAVPVAYMTEHDALITNARLHAGESVLVHAASSSVGVAAIQIARLWGVTQRCAADLLPALSDGRLRPVINRVFPLQEALAAQEYMASNAHIGKIVLTV